MQIRRLAVLSLSIVSAIIIIDAGLMSCGGGGSSIFATATFPPPGPRLISVVVCNGPAASQTPTPKPTVTPIPPSATPCPGATSTSVAQGSTVFFHADAVNSAGVVQDITNAGTTLWTSDSPAVLQPLTDPKGAFAGVSQGCACIAASSGGLSSRLVSVAVVGSSAPTCQPCAAGGSTSAQAVDDLAARASPPGRAGVLQWTFDAHSSIRGSMVASRTGDVYFVSADDVLHALDRNGRERFRLPARAIVGALGAHETIYAQDVDGRLRALAPDGSERWHLEIRRDQHLLTLGSDGTMYCASEGSLLSISPSGIVNWRVALAGVSAAAGSPDGGVIAGVSGDRVVAFARDGGARWSVMPAGGFAGGLAISGDIAYAGSAAGELDEISLDGSEMRAIAAGAPGVNAPIRSGPVAGANGIIYFGADRLYALLNGAIIWNSDIVEAGEFSLSALPYGGVLLAGVDGTIGSVTGDGTYRWGARLDGPILATPAASSDLVYLGAEDGRVYAIKQPM